MSYLVQRLGFDGRKKRWFDVERRPNKPDAIRYAALRQWGSATEHRVVDADNTTTVIWPEEE